MTTATFKWDENLKRRVLKAASEKETSKSRFIRDALELKLSRMGRRRKAN